MTDFPTPRFKAGDVVWTATAEDEAVFVECPDCKGSKTWTATSPAGETFSFSCPRCQRHNVWDLRHQRAVFALRRLTIGTVQLNTNDPEPVSYMCEETGIGSGTVWRESRLAADEDGAREIGRWAVADRETWRATELERRERNSGGAAGSQQRLDAALKYHTFTTAEIARAQTAKWQSGYKLENLCNAIAELDEYGDVEGLDSPTLERIVARLADTCPAVSGAREAILYDRDKARKAA